MKKTVILILLASIFITGCGNDTTEKLPKEQQKIGEELENPANEAQETVEKEKQDIEETNKQKESQQMAKEQIYTKEDVYIHSFECGYLSQEEKTPAWYPVVIETEEELLFAEENYGLSIPKEPSDFFDSSLADAFQEMKKQYPISKYTYVISYDEVSSGGYYLHADNVRIAENKIGFELDDSSYTPNEGDMVSEVMGGFCHIAAIPKEYLGNIKFENALYPCVNEEK